MATTQELVKADGKPLIELRQEPQESSSLALMRIVERAALEPTFDAAKLTVVLAEVRRLKAEAAHEEFNRAMNRFKANAPVIDKNKHVRFETQKGVTEYDHVTLDHACELITPALSAVGISHRYETSQAEGLITVICVLTHEQGHSERTTLQGLPDDSGGKNKIQAVGSTVSYLMRYTLLAATGLAAEGMDDDAASAFFKMPDVQGRLKELSEAPDLRALTSIFKTHYDAAREANDEKALFAFIKARDARKEALTK